jgi:non-ribosomal peptide synthetase component F
MIIDFLGCWISHRCHGRSEIPSLQVGGVQVALGYHHRPELTAVSFMEEDGIRAPFSENGNPNGFFAHGLVDWDSW